MLCFESFERRWRRRERTRYWVLERSVWRIESLRLRVGLLLLVAIGANGSEEEAARSSIDSICCVCILISVLWSRGECFWRRLTCRRTLSMVRSIRPAGHGSSSETPRSATQKRVRSWWSRTVDWGVDASGWSTEARMSSMSMVGGLHGLVD